MIDTTVASGLETLRYLKRMQRRLICWKQLRGSTEWLWRRIQEHTQELSLLDPCSQFYPDEVKRKKLLLQNVANKRGQQASKQVAKVESIEDSGPENELLMIFNRPGGQKSFQPYVGHRLDDFKSDCGPDLPPFDHMSICECGIITTGRSVVVLDESSLVCA